MFNVHAPICPSTSLSRTNTDLPTSSNFHRDADVSGAEHIMRCRVHKPHHQTNQEKIGDRNIYNNDRSKMYILSWKIETAAKSIYDRNDECALRRVLCTFTYVHMYVKKELNPFGEAGAHSDKSMTHRVVYRKTTAM